MARETLVIFTADNGHSGYTGWDKLTAAGHQPSGPYRGRKGDVWEGGHRVPFIARWPGRIAADASSPQLLGLVDVFATVAELVGSPLPAAGAEDSLSFASVLLGRPPSSTRRTTLVNHSNPGEFAYRDGPWKLVFRNRDVLQKSRGQPTVAELYNLDDDVGEKTDLAARHPEIVARLRRGLEQLIARGATRDVPGARNDATVRFDVTKPGRWAEDN